MGTMGLDVPSALVAVAVTVGHVAFLTRASLVFGVSCGVQRKNDEAIAAALADYHPEKDPNATNDPYKTLFIGRLSYEATERRLLVRRCVGVAWALHGRCTIARHVAHLANPLRASS